MIRRRYQTGSLVVRGKRKKVWVARWREPVLASDGTLTSIRRSEIIGTLADFPSKRQVHALLESRLHDLNHTLQKPQSAMLFRDFVNAQWEPAILPTLKYATQRNYRHLARRHLFPVFGDQPLCDIKRQHIQGFVMEKMLRQGLSWKRLFTSAICSVRYSPRQWSGSMCKRIRLGVLSYRQDRFVNKHASLRLTT
jgi:Phage integrase, N-terminal SAM-like domain